MSEYRIKIEEQYNGEKRYIPQICKLEITRGWIQRQRFVWYNILSGPESFIISDTLSAAYKTEADALRIIEDYKNKESILAGKKVKSVTYKYPDSSN